jgi:hypothetical protein
MTSALMLTAQPAPEEKLASAPEMGRNGAERGKKLLCYFDEGGEGSLSSSLPLSQRRGIDLEASAKLVRIRRAVSAWTKRSGVRSGKGTVLNAQDIERSSRVENGSSLTSDRSKHR